MACHDAPFGLPILSGDGLGWRHHADNNTRSIVAASNRKDAVMERALNFSSATDEEVDIATNLLLYKLLEQVGGKVTVTLEDAKGIADELMTKMVRVSFGPDSVVADVITRPEELLGLTGNA